MRFLYVSAIFGIVLLFLSGCTALNSAVQISNVSSNTITDIQADINIGDKVTSNCTVTRILGIPFGDFSWFSNKLADNVTYDTNRNNTNFTTNELSPTLSVVNFIIGIFGINGTVDTNECAKVAAYNLVTKEGIDVIYAPRYTADSSGFPILFRRTEVTLTGYRGNFVGFKQLDSQNMGRRN